LPLYLTSFKATFRDFPAAGVRKELGAQSSEIGSELEGGQREVLDSKRLLPESGQRFIGSHQEFKDKTILK
jgi:hypothetical protein